MIGPGSDKNHAAKSWTWVSKHLPPSLICVNKEMSNVHLHFVLHSTWCNLASRSCLAGCPQETERRVQRVNQSLQQVQPENRTKDNCSYHTCCSQTIILCLPRHVKNKQPSLWRHPPTEPQATGPRQGPCALLGEEQEQVLRGFFSLDELSPSFDKFLWGGQPSNWGNFIKRSSRRDERSRREKRILTQHLVRVVHTETVIRWDILALSWVTIF